MSVTPPASPLVSLLFEDVFPPKHPASRVLFYALTEPRLVRAALIPVSERRQIRGIGPKLNEIATQRLTSFGIKSRTSTQSEGEYLQELFDNPEDLPLLAALIYAQLHDIDLYGNACLNIVIGALRDVLDKTATLTDLTEYTMQEIYMMALTQVLRETSDAYAADFVMHGVHALDAVLYVGWGLHFVGRQGRENRFESFQTLAGA